MYVLGLQVYTNTFNSLQSLICFSRNKPTIIQAIERSIWGCILEISRGEKDALTALRGALHEIDNKIKDHRGDLFPLWFSG